jgi:hypothetical protein
LTPRKFGIDPDYEFNSARIEKRTIEQMKKQLSELSDRELQNAAERTWRKHLAISEERNRRKLIERYGADNPEMNTYLVWVIVEGSFDAKARSEEEAAQIIEGNFHDGYGVWLDYSNVRQIELLDGPIIRIHSVEQDELEDAAD